MKRKIDKWKIYQGLGIFFGIFAALISIYTFLKVDNISNFVELSRNWRLEIEITEPKDDTEITGQILKVAGRINFQTSANITGNHPNVKLALYQNKLEIVAFVRPISVYDSWYRQEDLIVHQDGSFEGAVLVGNKEDQNDILEAEIAVLVVPSGSISKKLQQNTLPFYVAISNIVNVSRLPK